MILLLCIVGRNSILPLLFNVYILMKRCTSGTLSQKQKVKLAAIYAGTNPSQLRKEIYQAVAKLWETPEYTGITEKKEMAVRR